MAQKCPHCDYPYVPDSGEVNKCPNCKKDIKREGCLSMIGGVIFLLILIVIIAKMCDGSAKSKKVDTNSEHIETTTGTKSDSKNIDTSYYNKSEQGVSKSYKTESENEDMSAPTPPEDIQKNISREPDKPRDVANVYYNSKYTLYDFYTDEPIFPDEWGIYTIYIASNEYKTPRKIVGNGNMISKQLFYKFKNYENCKSWCLQ